MFPLGGAKLCALDFRPDVQPPLPFRQRWAARYHSLRTWRDKPIPEIPIETDDKDPAELRPSAYRGGLVPTRKTSRAPSFNSIRPIPSTAPLDAAGIHTACPDLPVCAHRAYSYHEPARTARQVWSARMIEFAKGFIMPVSLAVILSSPCALIPPVKALFTEVPDWSGTRMPNAPDGRPPLAWVLDTAIFIGGIVIPAGLLLLGAGFARIKVCSSRWR